MSTEIQLFHRLSDREEDRIGVLPIAQEMLDRALGISALVPRVSNAAENEKAVEAQKALKEYLQVVEESRKFIKAPVLKLCSTIEDKAREITAEANGEMMRLSMLVGTYQEHENAKVRAAQGAQLKDLEEIERKRQMELAAAQTPDQADYIQLKYDKLARGLPIVEPVRVQGQTVTQDWEISVTDPWLLARSHPTCVDIKPRMFEIKALLKAGVKVAGVIAKKITKANVRIQKPAALEV